MSLANEVKLTRKQLKKYVESVGVTSGNTYHQSSDASPKKPRKPRLTKARLQASEAFTAETHDLLVGEAVVETSIAIEALPTPIAQAPEPAASETLPATVTEAIAPSAPVDMTVGELIELLTPDPIAAEVTRNSNEPKITNITGRRDEGVEEVLPTAPAATEMGLGEHLYMAAVHTVAAIEILLHRLHRSIRKAVS